MSDDLQTFVKNTDAFLNSLFNRRAGLNPDHFSTMTLTLSNKTKYFADA